MERQPIRGRFGLALRQLGLALVAQIVLSIEALQLAGVAANRALDLGCRVCPICLWSNNLRHLRLSIHQLLGKQKSANRSTTTPGYVRVGYANK